MAVQVDTTPAQQ